MITNNTNHITVILKLKTQNSEPKTKNTELKTQKNVINKKP